MGNQYLEWHMKMETCSGQHVWLQIQGSWVQASASHITLVQIDHEIISTTILPLLLIQDGQFNIVWLWPVNDQRFGESICSTWKGNRTVTVIHASKVPVTTGTLLIVFYPDSHSTCYKEDSSNLWSFRGQIRTILANVCALSFGQPVTSPTWP